MYTPFYHQLIRRYQMAFGAMFSSLELVRETTNRDEAHRFVVPIEYVPRETWLTRLRTDPELTAKVSSNVIPRLGYEMSSIRYDASRKLNGLRPRVHVGAANDIQRYFTGTPYLMTFNLYAVTRHIEDMNQLVEQILPYFSPDQTLTVRVLPSLGVMDRMRIVMMGEPQWADSAETDGFSKTREVIVTFTFTAAVTFYGPIASAPNALIRKVIVDLYETPYSTQLTDSVILASSSYDRLVLDQTGYILDESTILDLRDVARISRMTVEPSPSSAPPVHPVNTTTTIVDYVDGRQSNPWTGEDE